MTTTTEPPTTRLIPTTPSEARDIHADGSTPLVRDCCGDIHCDGQCLVPSPKPDLHYGARSKQS